MAVWRLCIVALLSAAVCGAAAAGTAGPEEADYFPADYVTELGELLSNHSGDYAASASAPVTGEGAATSAPVTGEGAATSAPVTGEGAATSAPVTGDYAASTSGAVTLLTVSESPGEAVTPVTVGPPVSGDLPQSRSIPALVTPVGSLCVCDLLVNACDVNCCCDPDCSAADFSVFSGCSIPVVTGDSQLCKREAVLYSTNTASVPQRITETVEIENPNIFCIQATNYPPALSFVTPDDPTAANFDSLLQEFGGMGFGSDGNVQNTVGSAAARNATKYEYGSPILTRASYLKLPAPLGTNECTDSNPVGFLQNQNFACSRNIQIGNCSIPVLTLGTYTNVEVLTVPTSQKTINVTLQAVTITSIDGAVSQGNLIDYIPFYDNTTGVCNDVVLGGSYTFTYTDQGEITGIAASFILGAIDANTFQQNFQIQFIENGTVPAPLSGNPGYVFGLPVLAGFKLPQSGIIQSTDRFGQLTLLKSSSDQDCLAQAGTRSPVLFGYNVISGCRLRLSYTGSALCKFASTAILNVLQGQQFPNYVAQFGNSQPENVLDWVPLSTVTTDQADVQGMCKIPVSLTLKISWTKYGSLVNPQAQIVNVEQNIAYALFPNNLDGVRFVQVSSSVSFVDVSQPASPGYKAQPTIDAKLPFDFFYPFL
ncbi:tectonic-1 [Dendropsophus ebraccatus]|uniref:tectonic-1 n=1 Tax=Dendropsophus ebraccatus TaxID=150705 RepID=UPI0038318CA7